MKKRFTILSLLICQFVFGQKTPISFVNYPKDNNESQLLQSSNSTINEIKLTNNKEFEFWSRPHISCFTWHEYNGTWKRKNDTIIFSDNYEIAENDAKFEFNNEQDIKKYKLQFRTDKNSDLKSTEIQIQFVYDYDAKLKDLEIKTRIDKNGNIEIPFADIPNHKELASIRYEVILPNNQKRYGYITENETVNKKESNLPNSITITFLEKPNKETVYRVTKGILVDDELKIISSLKSKSNLFDYMPGLKFADVYDKQSEDR
ncbi:MAG TPA: hypothetical protein VKY44_07440 [Flavobacterium sp.]|nr:hypothetical protein [Flavobacterium sp.]